MFPPKLFVNFLPKLIPIFTTRFRVKLPISGEFAIFLCLLRRGSRIPRRRLVFLHCLAHFLKKIPFLSGSAFSLGNKGALPRFRRAAIAIFFTKKSGFFHKKVEKKIGFRPERKVEGYESELFKIAFYQLDFPKFWFFSPKKRGGLWKTGAANSIQRKSEFSF